MPETIEISTKLIAFITAIIMLITAIIAFRNKGDNSQHTLTKEKKSIDSDLWEMIRFFAGFLSLFFILLAFMLGFKWFITVFDSIK